MSKRKQVDTLHEKDFHDFDDYITNDSSYHEKPRKKEETTFNFTTKKR